MFQQSLRHEMGETITQFVLYDAIVSAPAEGGGFHTSVSALSELHRDLRAIFSTPCRVGPYDIYEHDNLAVIVRSGSEGNMARDLQVLLFKPLPHDEIPAFLWAQVPRYRSDSHGVFNTSGG